MNLVNLAIHDSRANRDRLTLPAVRCPITPRPVVGACSLYLAGHDDGSTPAAARMEKADQHLNVAIVPLYATE
jgi:hypothetical protein